MLGPIFTELCLLVKCCLLFLFLLQGLLQRFTLVAHLLQLSFDSLEFCFCLEEGSGSLVIFLGKQVVVVLDLCYDVGVISGGLGELVLELDYRDLFSLQLLQGLFQLLVTHFGGSLQIFPAILCHEKSMLILLVLQLISLELSSQPADLLLVIFHVVIQQLDLQFLLIVQQSIGLLLLGLEGSLQLVILFFELREDKLMDGWLWGEDPWFQLIMLGGASGIEGGCAGQQTWL